MKNTSDTNNKDTPPRGIAATQALDHFAAPWLFASACAAMLPHLPFMPYWLSAYGLLIMCWAIWLWKSGNRLPGKHLITILVLFNNLIIWMYYKSFLGYEIGISLIFTLLSLKLLELRGQRDTYVVVGLSLFLVFGHLLESQSILSVLWMLFALVILTASLIRLHSGKLSQAKPILRQSIVLLLQAAPLMLILFIVFPRHGGPLWSLAKIKNSASSGLANQVQPGSISNLAQNSEVAFRVHFKEKVPEHKHLYWRGPVLDLFAGRVWSRRIHEDSENSTTIQAISKKISYDIILEPHQQRWLLALDAPIKLPPNATLSPDMSVLLKKSLKKRQLFQLHAALDYQFNVNEQAQMLRKNLQMPLNLNPRTQKLARSWSAQTNHNAQEIITLALQKFREEPFYYTLSPPLLTTRHTVDEFLFSSRRGFCEHYASTFAILMRAAGIPARLVSGYQGGEINPLNNELIVRQSDAHVWVEVWLEKQGWTRIDPTNTIAPSRIESGINASLADDEALPALSRINAPILRHLIYQWEAINSQWNLWVIGYNHERQKYFLQHLFGQQNINWTKIGIWTVGFFCIWCFAFLAWNLYRRPSTDFDIVVLLWKAGVARLKKSGVQAHSWEGPMTLIERAKLENPKTAIAFKRFALSYCQLRYGKNQKKPQWKTLLELLKQIKQIQ